MSNSSMMLVHINGTLRSGIEIVDSAKPVHEHPFSGNTAFLLGNEGQVRTTMHAYKKLVKQSSPAFDITEGEQYALYLLELKCSGMHVYWSCEPDHN